MQAKRNQINFNNFISNMATKVKLYKLSKKNQN